MAGWSGTPVIRAAGGGLAWTLLLETGDPYLDRYTLPMRTAMPADEVADWRKRIRPAWQIVADRHRWAAEPMAEVISAIVPLTPRSDTDLVSATSPAAYGAIATSWPPDEVTLAETLVHEFQHVKLCGLLDMVPLAGSGGQRVYAPWRQDPRPASGLLQGIYAHLGIVRFWQAQRHAETDPDGLLRAQVLFARWRPTIGETVQTLLETGSLTPAGVRFAERLRARTQLMSVPVPAQAAQIAAEVALDTGSPGSSATWRPIAGGGLADAYRRGDRARAGLTWMQEDVRKVDSGLRSRLLNLRYLDRPATGRCAPTGCSRSARPTACCSSGAAKPRFWPTAHGSPIPPTRSPTPGSAWRSRCTSSRRRRAGGAGHPAGAAGRGARPARRSGFRTDPLDLASWFT